MSEDETFSALLRTPFMSMVSLVIDQADGHAHTTESLVDHWATLDSDENGDEHIEPYWVEMMAGHGWTFRELIEESKRQIGV